MHRWTMHADGWLCLQVPRHFISNGLAVVRDLHARGTSNAVMSPGPVAQPLPKLHTRCDWPSTLHRLRPDSFISFVSCNCG
jgi:hypothetical protein